jgi:3D (Asp-Asp-Asp) domain-containing protein
MTASPNPSKTFEGQYIGRVTLTSYRSVKEQTDSTPFNTSTGAHVRAGGVAVSRDLLCADCRRLHRRCVCPVGTGQLHYGDWVYISGVGYFEVNDVMGSYTSHKVHSKWVRTALTNHLDVWLGTYSEEKRFDKTHRGKVYDVWKVNAVTNVR